MPSYALEIPEIRFQLAQYLNRSSLIHCALVSRDWNATFQDWIYREIETLPKDLNPKIRVLLLPRSTLDRRLHAIRKLGLREQESGLFASSTRPLNCPNLKSLRLQINLSDSPILIHNHRQTLTTLSLCGSLYAIYARDPDFYESWWRAAASCSSLEMLCMYWLELKPKAWSCFWSLWSRLTGLRLKSVRLYSPTKTSQQYDSQHQDEYTSFLQGLCPSRIKTLEMSEISGLASFDNDLLFLSFCPVVETFIWRPIHSSHSRELPHMSLVKQLAERTRNCPSLAKLKLCIDGIEQRDCLKSSFLDSRVRDDVRSDDGSDQSSDHIKNKFLPRSLESLTLQGQILVDKICFQRLEQQAGSTLRTLKLTLYLSFDGKMIHQILCSLPVLESFTTSYWFRTADDFSEFPDRPWACVGLRKLTIFNAAEPSDEEYQEEVYRRFGITFKKLRSLKRSGGSMDWTKARRHLGGLDSLEFFEDYCGEMTEDDARWMIEHWTRLECILGSPHPEHHVREELGKILREHGIRQHLVREVVHIA